MAASLCLAGCGGGAAGGSTGPTTTSTDTTPAPSGSFDYKGITHVSWWHDTYQGATGADSRQALAGLRGNWAGVLVTWYMDTRDSTTIVADAERTPSEDALGEAIRHFHALGLKVMLKPHVDVRDGTWRGDVRPATAAWFASYGAYMTSMARLAEKERVEMLCVGTELARLSGSDVLNEWTSVITSVRALYHGPLTYAANATSAGDEFTRVSFWSQLDLAGLDAYAPLTAKNDPTPSELIAAWSRNSRGDDMLGAFRNWQRSHGKPVIFTEIGYRSGSGANRSPWDYGVTLAYDVGEQRDCYYAAHAVFLPERSWMKGMFWWAWDVEAPAANDTGYSPRNKPAGDLLRLEQGGASVAPP